MTTSPGLTRSWALIDALSGHAFEGLRLMQLATATGASASTTLRDLQALESLGRAERVPGKDDRWRLSPRVVQIAIAHQHELSRLNQRVDEFAQRYSRIPT
jgi:DNA-binding IclR family transcriptional regulator